MNETTLPPIVNLLPHAGSAVLLDCLTEENENGVTASAIPRVNHPFLDPALGGVPVWVGIEMMAQAIAAHAGLENCHRGKAPKVGYLLGTRRFTGHIAAFPIDMPLQIEVQRLYLEDSGLAAYDCWIYGATEEWARATITVFQTDDAIGT